MINTPNPTTYPHHPTQPYRDQVAAHRAASAGYYPMPATADNAIYAIEETGEYLDARMRSRPSDHKRNNERQPDPAEELAQMGYMIASTAISLEAGDDEPAEYADELAAAIAANMASALRLLGDRRPEAARQAIDGAFSAWVHLCQLTGHDPAELLDQVAAKIDRKHKPAPDLWTAAEPAQAEQDGEAVTLNV